MQRVASSAVEHPAFNRLVLSSNLRRPIPVKPVEIGEIPSWVGFFNALRRVLHASNDFVVHRASTSLMARFAQ